MNKKSRELKNQIELEIQLIEKQKKFGEEYQKNLVFHELNRREIKIKEEEADLKRKKQIKKLKERNELLSDQINQIKTKKKKELEKVREE